MGIPRSGSALPRPALDFWRRLRANVVEQSRGGRVCLWLRKGDGLLIGGTANFRRQQRLSSRTYAWARSAMRERRAAA